MAARLGRGLQLNGLRGFAMISPTDAP
jgi:hypothetical protein